MTSTPDEVAKNPFFTNEINDLCLVCNKKLDKNKTHGIHDKIPSSKESVEAISVLQTYTNFSNYDLISGPQNMCAICFSNTSSLHKFLTICEKGLQNIIAFNRHQAAMIVQLGLDESVKTETANDLDIDNEDTTENCVEDVKSEKDETNIKYNPPSSVQCKVCLKMYKTKNYLRLHMRIHTGYKPYKCKYCSSTFSCPTSLKLHTVTHTNIRAHLCKVCGSSFKLAAHLRNHEIGHTGVKRYSCTVCGKRFTNLNSKNRHKLIHTNEKPFQCEVCAKSFNRKSNLVTHLKSHSGIKEHECLVCGNRFTQAHSLRAHMKKHGQNI